MRLRSLPADYEQKTTNCHRVVPAVVPVGARMCFVALPHMGGSGGTGEVWARMGQQLKAMTALPRETPAAAWMLAAFLTYNEGIGTIIKLAAIYGAEMGLPAPAMIGSILIVQFT